MSKRLSNSDWIAISVFLVVITLLSTWTIDVSVSALLSEGILFNGFFVNSPAKMYHFGLYLIILVCFFNFLILLHVISRQPDKKSKGE
jgi:hypothetical protein